MTQPDELPCCTAGCPETVPVRRAELFPAGRATCLVCGAKHAAGVTQRMSRSVVTLHKSGSTYVPPTPAGRQFVRDVAAMRRGEGGQ